MTTQEQNSSLQTLDAQQRAEFVPKQYFDVISNRADNSRMQPALIFSADNLKSIKRYVDYVLRLPQSVEEITGSHDFSLLGIEPDQVYRLYTDLRTHVGTWDVLERETKTLGTRLELFAETFIGEGEQLVDKLKATEAYRALRSRLGDVIDDVSLTRVSYKPLDEGERQQIVSLNTYLTLIAEDILEVRSNITAIKERALWFTDAVVKQLRPEIDGLTRQIKEVNAEKIIADLREQIVPLDKEIEQLNAAYDQMVGLAFTGLIFGPIGVAITGGIYGSKAEAVRATHRRLSRQRDVLARQIVSINPMIGIFETTSAQIADLKFRLTEVQTAAKNLEDVWNMLGVYVEQSAEDLGQITSDGELATFILRFERVVRPWRSIRDISSQLSKIFNETMDEISKQGAPS